MNLEQLFTQYKEQSISGRYLTLDHIKPLLDKLNTDNQVQTIGKSVLGEPIYSYQIGTGKIRVYLWSQMHGNESTTTKALFDFINLLNDDTDLSKKLLETFTFYSIPILNPDGARLYTRANANEIDLNRDSQDLTQPESRVLREAFENFEPDFCFNLHDQRTIFGAGTTGNLQLFPF